MEPKQGHHTLVIMVVALDLATSSEDHQNYHNRQQHHQDWNRQQHHLEKNQDTRANKIELPDRPAVQNLSTIKEHNQNLRKNDQILNNLGPQHLRTFNFSPVYLRLGRRRRSRSNPTST